MSTRQHAFAIRLAGETLAGSTDEVLRAKIEEVWLLATAHSGFKHARVTKASVIKEALWRGLVELEAMYRD